MHGLLQDLCYASRTLAKNPGFVFTTVISLALGIGINTALFSIIHTSTERPVSGRNPQELVDLGLSTPAGRMSFSYPEYMELRSRTRTFSDVVAFMGGRYRISGQGRPAMVSAEHVSDNFFTGFGQQSALGRALSTGKPGAAEAVLSHGFWTRRFGRDPGVIGRPMTLHLGEKRLTYTIVGVVPPDFRYTSFWTPDLIVPLPADAEFRGGKQRFLSIMARVKPGLPLLQARAETETLAGQLGALFPESFGKARLTFTPKVRRDVQSLTAAAALLAVVSLVLLIACVNVMNLLLARHQSRRTEMATRMALGASRGRLMRQLLLESVTLAVPSALAGYGLAAVLMALVERLPIPGKPDFHMYFYLDWTVLAYAVFAGLAAAFLAGLWPARAASKPDLVPALKGAGSAVGSRKFGLRGALVAAQLALSMVAVTATGMIVKGILDLNPYDSGVDPHKVVAAAMWPGLSGYTDARTADFRRHLTEQLARQGGVERVAVAAFIPGTDGAPVKVLHTGSHLLPKQESLWVRSNQVGPGYFQTLGIRILRGREYRDADMNGRPVAVVNDTMARRFWPGQEPLGQMVRVVALQGEAQYEVIGVARDTAYERTGNDFAPFLYLPVSSSPFAAVVVRTTGKAAPFTENVRRSVAAFDPEMPVIALDEFATYLIGGQAGTALRLRAWVMGALGGTALLLSSLGLYGVIAYLVTRRTREIGIRLALGAGRTDVLRAVMTDGSKVVGVGMAAGAALSFVVCPLLSNNIFGLKPNQPVVLAAACGLLAMVAVFAMLVPARRACKVDALIALRYE